MTHDAIVRLADSAVETPVQFFLRNTDDGALFQIRGIKRFTFSKQLSDDELRLLYLNISDLYNHRFQQSRVTPDECAWLIRHITLDLAECAMHESAVMKCLVPPKNGLAEMMNNIVCSAESLAEACDEVVKICKK